MAGETGIGVTGSDSQQRTRCLTASSDISVSAGNAISYNRGSQRRITASKKVIDREVHMTHTSQLRFDGNALSKSTAGKPANTCPGTIQADVEVGGTG
jgi:hypothetical protein